MGESKESQLLKWMWQKKIFASHDIAKWGLDNYYLRARRTCREFAKTKEKGGLELIRRLSKWEKKLKEIICKDAVYEINEGAIRKYFQPSLFKLL